MVWDKLESNITNGDEQEPVKKQGTTPIVVPVVEESAPQQTASEKPVEEYYIEKTSQEPDTKPDNNKDDNDDIDTSIDPNARISISPSIAICKNTDEITNTMAQAVNSVVANINNNSSDESFYKAQTLLSGSNPYKCFDEINFAKSSNIYGKAVFEGNYINLVNNEPSSKQSLSRDSERVDLGLNWKSKPGNTKIFAFGSFTHTDSKLKIESLGQNTELDEAPLVIKSNLAYNSYSFYGAAQHKLKNGDIVTGSGFHINDSTQEITTTSFDASYFLKKFMVLAEGKTTINKVGSLKSVSKTDFSISLNPELAFELPQKEKNNLDENKPETEENSAVSNTNGKNWSTDICPFFESQSISGQYTSSDVEEGLGIKVRVKKTDTDSNFRFASFGKLSTSQQEENNRYHVTFGSGIKYAKNIGTKSLLKAEAEVKNRYTFGHENILTASAHALYTFPKLSLEAEAKNIFISGNQNSYAAIVGRAYYTPIQNVNLYAEASYTNYKDTCYKLSGTNIQAGFIVNL